MGKTDWQSILVEGNPDANGDELECDWSPPADPQAIAGLEKKLGIKLPADLREFLEQFDGVMDNGGGAFFVMSAEDIGAWTEETRTNYADWEEAMADRLLFFGNWPANGDMYAYVIKPQKPGEKLHDIVYFDHETGEDRPLAKNLAELLQKHMIGGIN